MRSLCENNCQFGFGDSCYSKSSGHLRFCELAATNSRYRDLVIERSDASELHKIKLRTIQNEPHKDIVIRSNVIPYTGYGYFTQWLARSLEATGYDVGIVCEVSDERYLKNSDYVKRRFFRNARRQWEILVGTPARFPEPLIPTVFVTMWESDRLKADHVANINMAELVIVPSEWVKSCFLRSGVTKPIEVIPLGVDRAVYLPRRTIHDGIFRFGSSGRRSHGGIRKGHETVIKAFLAEFPEPDVRLRLKLWPDCLMAEPPLLVPDDPRIEVITTPMDLKELAEWYSDNDVFVSGSMGEGFGLQQIESMSCGVPVISTDYSGNSGYFDDHVGWVIDYDLIEGVREYLNSGVMAAPKIDSMRRAMRRAYVDRTEVEIKARNSIVRAKEMTWWMMGERFAEVLCRYGYLRAKQPVMASSRLMARVGECPHVITRNCNCKTLKCAMGHGKDGEVDTNTCFPCVEGTL